MGTTSKHTGAPTLTPVKVSLMPSPLVSLAAVGSQPCVLSPSSIARIDLMNLVASTLSALVGSFDGTAVTSKFEPAESAAMAPTIPSETPVPLELALKLSKHDLPSAASG